ncbi:hypothetical protein TNCV_982231 [Trichonephila clavipes]|nr:hypothetical protein TNCV_982231 [Trichonephila clavipes]
MMLNRFYFPPTFRIPTFICGAGPENQHMTSIVCGDNSGPKIDYISHQLRCLCRISKKRPLQPSQNIQKKKDVKSIIFPNQTIRILPTFFCGAGPENQHMTSITKNDNSGLHKIFNKKKMLNRFYFPPTRIPPTFVFGAVPDIQLRTSIKKNDNSGRHKIFNRKKRC